MDSTQVESGWVNMCPYLEVRAPHPLVADQDPTTKDVKEVYEFFKSEDSQDPMGKFLEQYNRLPRIPGPGETKMAQVLRAVRLIKIMRQAKVTEKQTIKTLEKMGIKV